jgi:hypothetical protein
MREIVDAIKAIDESVAKIFIMKEELLYAEAQEEFFRIVGDGSMMDSFADLAPAQQMAMAIVCLRELRHKLHESLREGLIDG